MSYNGIERAGNKTGYGEAVWRVARVKPPPLGLGTAEESDATGHAAGIKGLLAVDHGDAEQAA